ncbi:MULTISPECIES: hypothetical protein [unclassified Streptomyces]|uniref:hypothetical protein n=1 Tax=unclassified Streptomyces TaxID=2593676 RepID=UPI0036E19488
MGPLRLTLCTGLLTVTAAVTAAVTTVTTPAAHAAHAAEGADVTVTPSTPLPGTDIALRVNGCATRTGTATSTAFVADVRLSGTAGTLTGETRIRTDLRAGSYDVEFTCGDTPRRSALNVVDKTPHPTTTPAPPTTPTAPVRAGGGGAAHLASVDDAGPGTAQAVTGLVLAAVAAAAVALRRVRRGRGTD